MRPDWTHQRLYADVFEVVIDNEFQVFIYRENHHHVKFHQLMSQDLLVSFVVKGVIIERFHILRLILIHGHEHYRRVHLNQHAFVSTLQEF